MRLLELRGRRCRDSAQTFGRRLLPVTIRVDLHVGNPSGHELDCRYPQGPDVDLLIIDHLGGVLIRNDEFRSHPKHRSNERACHGSARENLREAEVAEADFSAASEQEVLGFDIPMDPAVEVKACKSGTRIAKNGLGNCFRNLFSKY